MGSGEGGGGEGCIDVGTLKTQCAVLSRGCCNVWTWVKQEFNIFTRGRMCRGRYMCCKERKSALYCRRGRGRYHFYAEIRYYNAVGRRRIRRPEVADCYEYEHFDLQVRIFNCIQFRRDTKSCIKFKIKLYAISVPRRTIAHS